METLSVVDLRCERAVHPPGVGAAAPRFSWVLATLGRDCIQSSYHLQVDAGTSFSGPTWDSGVVGSRESVEVEYAGPPLAPGTRYWWRVRVADTSGRQSAWSEQSWFETAGVPPGGWQAEFIGVPGESAAESRGLRLRRGFALEHDISRARIYASALGLYELRVNGAPAGDALFTPGWSSYDKRLRYQSWDVTRLLRAGENAIGVTLGAGWYKGDLVGWDGARNVWGSRTALILELHVQYRDGGTVIVKSDGSWRCAQGPILFSEIYHGEIYDARLEAPGWGAPAFDDSRWTAVEVIPADRDRLVPDEGPAVRRQQELAAVRLFTTPGGERVLDFGQNIAGWVRFGVTGRAGDRVVLRHAETLDAEGNFYTANLRAARARIEYTLRGGARETFEPHFSFQGFRYAAIDEYPGEPRPEDFRAVVIHSDLEETGTFECSEPLLDRLHANIGWSLRGNLLDLPTDCPQRDERLGWTGDAQVFIGTACFLRDTATFYERWLLDLAADQGPDGSVPHVVPDVLSRNPGLDPAAGAPRGACGWADAAVVCPWTLYVAFGDRRVLARQYPGMRAWVEYVRRAARGGVLWDSGRHFGDWVALDAAPGSYHGATPNELCATAYYAYSTSLLARAASVLGLAADAREYAALHGRIVEAFRGAFFGDDGRLIARTQTAHVMALVLDLVREEHRTRCVEDLAALIAERGGHLATGFLGTPWLLQALSANGRLDDAYALLLKRDFPSWLYQVTRGATTIWEHWDGIRPDGTMWSEAMNSFNHYAYGAVGAWMHEVIGGLAPDPAGAGYASLIVHPRPGGGITWARTALRTVRGLASVAWRIESGRMKVDLLVPHNSTARVTLPRAVPAEISGDEASFVAVADGAGTVLGSGRWRFEYPLHG